MFLKMDYVLMADNDLAEARILTERALKEKQLASQCNDPASRASFEAAAERYSKQASNYREDAAYWMSFIEEARYEELEESG